MGIRVDYGPVLGQIEFPDEMSEEQVKDYALRYNDQLRSSLAARAQQSARQKLGESETTLEAVDESPILAAGAALGGQAGSLGQFSRLGATLGSPAGQISEVAGIGDWLRSFSATRDLPRATPTFEDIGQAYEERGALDAAREAGAFLSGNVVEQTPNLIATIATGSALGLAQIPARAAAIAAPFLTTLPVEAGGAFQEIEERTGRADPMTAAAALGVGGVNALIESASEAPILGQAMAPVKRLAGRFLGDSVLGAFGRTAAGAAGEGLGEFAQEMTTGMTPEVFGAERDPNLMSRGLEAFAAGASVGGPFSAAASFSGLAEQRREKQRQEAALNEALLAGKAAQEFGLQRNAIVQQAAQAEQAAVVQFTQRLGQIDQAASKIPIQTPFDQSRIAAEAAAAKLDALTDLTATQLATSGVVGQADRTQSAINDEAAAKVEAVVAATPPAPVPPQAPARASLLAPSDLGLMEEISTEAQTPVDWALAQQRVTPAAVPTIPTSNAATPAAPTPTSSSPASPEPASSVPAVTPPPLENLIPPQSVAAMREARTADTEQGLADAVEPSGATPVDQAIFAGRRIETEQDLTEVNEEGGTTPVDEFVRNRPAVLNPLRARRVAEERKRKRRKLGDVRPKKGEAGRQAEAVAETINPAVSDLANLTPGEVAQREYDQAMANLRRRRKAGRDTEAVERPTLPDGATDTNKTRYLRFQDEVQEIIENHPAYGDVSTDPTAVERIFEKVTAEAARSFEKAQAEGKEWKINFAVKSAKVKVFQEISNITREGPWKKGAARKQSLEGKNEDGETVTTDIPVPAAIERTAEDVAESSDEARLPIVDDETSRAVQEAVISAAIKANLKTSEEMAALFYRVLEFGVGKEEAAERAPGVLRMARRFIGTKPIETAFNDYVLDEVKDLRFAIAKNLKFSISAKDVTDAIVAAVGKVPDGVTVISDPRHVLPDGRSGVGVAGYVDTATGNVVLNAAFIDSPTTAVRVLIEEFSHLAFRDPEVAQAWEVVKSQVTEADVQAAIDEGYSQDQAVEEAAIENVLRYMDGLTGPTGAIHNFLSTLWSKLKSLLGFGNQYDNARNEILRRVLESIRESRPASGGQSTLRLSRADGWFVNQEDASIAIAETQAKGGEGVEQLATVAQLEGELVPRSTMNEVDRMSKGTLAERIAARAVKIITDIGNLADGSFLAGFPRLYATARSVLDLPENERDLAAEAVVRAHLAIGARRNKLQADIIKAQEQLAAAVAELPKAAEATADAKIAEVEGEMLLNGLEVALKNELATARARDVIQAEEVSELQTAASKVGEAKRSITPAIGNALAAIAREIPDTITGQEQILQWVEQRLKDKSLPPIMSDTVAKFLVTPLSARGKPPIAKIKIDEVIASLKELRDARSTAQAELEQFKKDFHGGKTTPTGKGKKVSIEKFATKYAKLREEYRNGLRLARAISVKVAGLQAKVDGLSKALRVVDQMQSSRSYFEKIDAAARTINAMDSAIKLTTGTKTTGSPNLEGTISIVDPVTQEVVVMDLAPKELAVAETTEKIQTVLGHIEQILGDVPDMDPLVRIRLERDYERLKDMLGGSKWYLRTMIPKWVPLVGATTVPGLATLATRLPWFGRRLASPNNVISWIGGPAGRELPAIMNARDVAGKKLENLREDQTKIDLMTIEAMKAHGMDIRNGELQKQMAAHISRIQSQFQAPGSKPYRVGDWNGIEKMEVKPLDMQVALSQKRLEDSILSITRQALPKGVTRNLFNDFLGVAEVFKDRSIARSSANYGMKMSRRESRDAQTVIGRWLRATERPAQLALMSQYFDMLVMGIALETDPTFVLKPEKLDRELFNELVALERTNSVPFDTFDGFVDWIADRWAAENGTTAVDERKEVEDRMIRYISVLATRFADDAAKRTSGGLDIAALNEVRESNPAVVQALTAENQFTRPRGALNGPSTWYSYDLTGTTAQETYKGSLMNVMLARELAGWANLRKALRNALFDYDQRKLALVKGGMSERDAVRKLQAESRERSRSVSNEVDYATLRDLIMDVEAMLAELNRIGNERIEAPADTGPARTGKAVVSMFGSQMLSSGSSMINNTVGMGVIQAVVAQWLGRLSLRLAGPKYYGEMVKGLTGRALQLFGEKVGWFGDWLKQNGPVVDAINGLIASSALRRQRAVSALTLDVPNVRDQVSLISQLPGSYGALDPGRSQETLEWAVNMLQSGFGVGQLKSVMPTKYHKIIDVAAKSIPTVLEQIKRFAPGTLDRMGNAVTGQIYNDILDDAGFKKVAYDIITRKRAMDPGSNLPSSPNYQILDDQWGDAMGAPAIKFLRDVLAPIGSLEAIINDWYDRVGGNPAAIATTPLLSEADQDAAALQFIKLTNLRTESSRSPAMKGKGLSGFWRNFFFQFGGYGANLAGVLDRRWSAISGGGDDELSKKWLAGLAMLLLFLGQIIFGSSLKGIWKDYIDNEPRTVASLSSAVQDPELAARYLAAAAASQLPYFGDQLQKIAGGTIPSSPFDLTRSIPGLGVGQALYTSLTTAIQTGDPVYPAIDLLRQTVPLSKPLVNRLMSGDVARREAYRGVRANAPSTFEMKEFSGGGGRSTPMQPLIRSAVNAYLDGDMAGYTDSYNKAVQYQMGLGKTRDEAVTTVNSSISARDPIRTTIGREITPAEEQSIVRRLSPRQRNAFLRARSLTTGLKAGRTTSRTNPFRKRRQKAKRRTWSQS